MSLLETLKKVKEDGFDPKTNKINDSGLLSSGKYPVRLTKSEHNVNLNTNREQVIVTLEVVSGSAKDRKEMIFLVFDPELPEFVVDKNSKILLSIAAFTGVEFSEKDLANEETTAEALARGIGKQFLMDLKVVPNKKNPDFPYRNYEFSALPESGEADFSELENENVGEDDLPF